MSTPLRKSKTKYIPNTVTPKTCGKPSFSTWGFIFSDDLQKWIKSGNVSSKEYKNAKPLF